MTIRTISHAVMGTAEAVNQHQPLPAPAPQGFFTWDGNATIIAAVLAAIVVVIGYRYQQRQARKDRRATIYGEALRAVEDYLEAPYRIKRKDGTASTQQAITVHISEIQSRIAYYEGLLQIHAPDKVSTAYRTLIAAARKEAGPQMTAAWLAKPTRVGRHVTLIKRYSRSLTDVALEQAIETMKRDL